MTDDADRLATLLSEGLDLCIRARKLDDPIERLPVGHPENDCGHYVLRARSATPHLWVRDQYDKDLADWEGRSRKTLMAMGRIP